ncbi:hypothetical protein MET9862_02103 [Methylobacterium symbioticum]|jgi:hypothetical protein|uniref:Uncharacterized protein n=1 Tax=Methylobacterium symbioticum TaxID=2584084 RepID=A0A509EBE3_9HYPH|nr:hypothetical protein MET9862_02103 [Methylobacterium symbioticum]
MTQRIKPDRPIWPTAPSDTRSAPADTQTRPRPRTASAAS